MQAAIRDAFDAFVIEVMQEDVPSFHHINHGNHRLFIYVASKGLYDNRDSTRCIPNVATWFVGVGCPEWDCFERTQMDFYDISKASFDPLSIIRVEDAKCAAMYPNEYNKI